MFFFTVVCGLKNPSGGLYSNPQWYITDENNVDYSQRSPKRITPRYLGFIMYIYFQVSKGNIFCNFFQMFY